MLIILDINNICRIKVMWVQLNTEKDVKTHNRLVKKINLKMLLFTLEVILFFVVINVIFEFSYIKGKSMEPTVYNKDVVIVNKLIYKLKEPKYKDVVIFHSDIDGGKYLIKRVIGVPGDTIKITNGKLYVNKKEVKENYIKNKMINKKDYNVKIPQGKIFVMGDNRNVSLDSRDESVGLINYKHDIKGKAVMKVFPLKKMCYLN